MIIYGYGRMSTDHQVDSPKQQESVVRKEFEHRKATKTGWADAEWGGFVVDEVVGRTTQFRCRERGSLLLATCKAGDWILVANFDRIFANTIDVCETLEIIRERQIKLCVLDMDIDLSSDLGEACFTILAAIKRLEVREIQRRCRESASYRKQRGLPHTVAPIGWKTIRVLVSGKSRSYFTPDPVARARALQLLEMKNRMNLSMPSTRTAANRQGLWNLKGKCWSLNAIIRWVRAAQNDFPLQNGCHEPTPMPDDARPINSISDDD